MRSSLRRLILIAAMSAAIASCRGPGDGSDALSLPKRSADESADSTITLVPPGFERSAAGLSHLFHVSGDVFGTIDPIDGDVLFLDKRGRQLGASRLPEGFDVRDIDLGSSIVLRGDKAAVVILRRGAVPAELRSVALPAPSTTVTRSGRALDVTLKTGDRTSVMQVAPRGPGQVLAVTALGLDRDDRAYVYWEEGEARTIDAWVGRFAKDGMLVAAIKLDFSDFAEVPAVPVAVAPDGTLMMIQPSAESVELIELTLENGSASSARET